jgi:superfamily II DNA/RNA helicase
MLDMGFIPDVERIVAMLPANRQTLFFSATMAPEIVRLSKAFLQNPKTITVSRSASVATTIVEAMALVAEHDKREALRRIVRNEKVQNALVFCNRKRDVDILYKSLSRHHFSVGALHGDMAQPVRFATLEKFKAGELQLLVCSDVAARGLDIGGLSHVFNFDVPHHAEDYVHRIGRTGRAGLEGHAFTLATPEDRLAVEAIEKLTGKAIPRVRVDGLDEVEWAAEDGRRRGRSPGRSAARAPARSGGRSRPEATTADERPRAEPRKRAPRTPREQPPAAPVAAAPVAAAPVAEVAEAELPLATPRERPAAPPAPAPREHARPTRRREPRGRDDEGGANVLGFGEDMPAFMTLRRRAHYEPPAELQASDESEATSEDAPLDQPPIAEEARETEA